MIGIWPLIKRVWQQIGEDSIPTWGAALAYSWLFAIFPFLVFLLSLVPLFPDRFKIEVRGTISAMAEPMPDDAASLLMKQVDNVLSKPSAGGFLSFGLILTVWAASGGMSMTISAIDKAYDIDKGRRFIKHRSLAIMLTMIVATLMILTMILLPIGTGVLKWLAAEQKIFGWLYVLINVIRYPIALLLMFTVLAIIYHFGPSVRQKFVAVTPGAVFSVAVWLLLGYCFKLYLTRFGGAANYNKTYGAVAGAAILLLFFYIDAMVLLIGAEINSEIDFALKGLGSGGRSPSEPSQGDPAQRDL